MSYFAMKKGQRLEDESGKEINFETKEEAKQEIKRRGYLLKEWGIYKRAHGRR